MMVSSASDASSSAICACTCSRRLSGTLSAPSRRYVVRAPIACQRAPERDLRLADVVEHGEVRALRVGLVELLERLSVEPLLGKVDAAPVVRGRQLAGIAGRGVRGRRRRDDEQQPKR